jgi:hypothetical protein
MTAVEIRLPRRTRALYAAYFGLIGALVLLGGGLATAEGSPAALLVAVPFAGLGALAATRFSRLAVTAEGETLHVRNILATRRIRRARIQAFRLGPHFMGGQAIRAVLKDGASLPFDITLRPWYVRKQDQQLVWVDSLRTWVDNLPPRDHTEAEPG